MDAVARSQRAVQFFTPGIRLPPRSLLLLGVVIIATPRAAANAAMAFKTRPKDGAEA